MIQLTTGNSIDAASTLTAPAVNAGRALAAAGGRWLLRRSWDGPRHGTLDDMGEGGFRRVSVRRARWERWSGPVECWLRNRWNWRRARRVRADIQRWKTLVIPLDQLAPHDDPDVQRMAADPARVIFVAGGHQNNATARIDIMLMVDRDVAADRPQTRGRPSPNARLTPV